MTKKDLEACYIAHYIKKWIFEAKKTIIVIELYPTAPLGWEIMTYMVDAQKIGILKLLLINCTITVGFRSTIPRLKSNSVLTVIGRKRGCLNYKSLS
jgi:hypothetical protein